MGWETRDRGASYYYEKKRIGSRVSSVYVGAGLAGTLAEVYAQRDRAEKAAEREALRREMAKQDAIDSRIDEVCRMTETFVRAVLIAAGFHQHKGQWRRKKQCAKR
jgi:hypothetical protein